MNENTPEQRDALDRLRTEPKPPARLEENTVAELRSLGLIRRRSPWPWIYAAAAFVLGLTVGYVQRGPTPSPRPGYLLLLDDGDVPVAVGDESTRVEEYADWARQLREEGVPIAGERLEHARSIGAERSSSLDVSGYFLFDADSDERALAIAASCPHARHGGSMMLGKIAR